MSSVAAPGSLLSRASGGNRPRSMLARVLGETVARWGARFGLAWIAVVAFLGIGAPLLASSYPILVRTADGRLLSPLLANLSATDVALLVGAVAAVVLVLLRRFSGKLRLGAWVVVLAMATAAGHMATSPDSNPVYDRWRVMVAEQEVRWAVFTLIPYSPNDRVRDRSDLDIVGPWWAGHKYNHWLGQDPLRQDIASRMIHASRIALAIGFIATGIAATLGILIGAPMGYFAKAVDLVGMRLVEVFEFIPQLYLLLIFIAFFPGDRPEILPGIHIQRIYLIMAIIGFTGWTGYARFVRAEFLKLREQDFVAAARACALPLRSILFRHMLPNGLTPVLVSASFGVASAILAEATLSFLGLGLIEEPSWGGLLNQSTRAGSFIWWIAVFPGAAIFLTVLAYNLIGEALRDAIDPHTKKTAHL